MNETTQKRLGLTRPSEHGAGPLARALPDAVKVLRLWSTGHLAGGLVVTEGDDPLVPPEGVRDVAGTQLGPVASGSADAVVTLLPAGSEVRALQAVVEVLEASGGELLEARGDGRERRSLTLSVRLAPKTDLHVFREAARRAAGAAAADSLVEEAGPFRTRRRVVCLDVDSTFCQGEFIDELAAKVGVKDQVADITRRAMHGELDFEGALRSRVELLAGLPLERVHEVCAETQLMPGAENLVRTLKSLGFRVGIVSGGFTVFIDQLRERFDLDFGVANALEARDGKLTGKVEGAIVTKHTKQEVLERETRAGGARLEQAVAAGDGANDLLMVTRAGLGVAFRAKPALRAEADLCLDHNDRLDAMLPVVAGPDVEGPVDGGTIP